MSERIRVVLFSIAVVTLSVFITQSKLGKNANLAAYDQLLNRVAPKPAPIEDKIAIIGIDDESYDKLDAPLLLYVGFFAKIINALADAGATIVVFDINPAASLEKVAPQIDLEFMKSMKRANDMGTRVYLGFKSGKIGGLMPHRKFLFASNWQIGFTDMFPDDDGLRRRQEFWTEGPENSLVPSLSMTAATARMGIDLADKEKICARFEVCENGKPKQRLIDYRISQEKVVMHQFHKVLEKAENRTSLKDDFGGKVVFIGSWTDKLPDNWRVPHPIGNLDKLHTPGLAIQVQNVLTQISPVHFEEPSENSMLLATIILSVLSVTLMFKLQPSHSSFILTSVAVAWIAVVVYSFSKYLVLPVAPVVYGLFLPSGLARSYLYVSQGKQQKVLKKFFGSYISPEVMKDILKNPEKVNFDGSLVDITIVFTDIRNFTTLSEKLSPVDVTRGLNRYLSAMTRCITESGGYVNRYLGDGILALYGAPAPLPNRGALEAVKGGLAMLKALEELNKEELFPGVSGLKIGIGIHTGKAIVGNVGCFEKMDYTVIGDAANLSSRVEGLTKQYGVPILISEATYEIVKDAVEVKYVDSVKVKGREHETAVYTVVSLKGEKI